MTARTRISRTSPTLKQVYGTSKERKAMTKEQREVATRAYLDYTLSNKPDDGRKGKAFEVMLRKELNPHTITLKCQSQNFTDLPISINGKRIRIECKTGGGDISNNLWLEDWRNELDLIDCLDFDYIAYTREYNGTVEELYTNTIIMTKYAFINWLLSYDNKKPYGLLTYKTNEGRLMIANPKASKKRLQYIDNLVEWAKSHSGCYTLNQFMTMANRLN